MVDPRERLLGGWRDLKEDVTRLRRMIGSGDGVCACRFVRRRVPCPCSDAMERDHTAFCDSCASDLLAVEERVGRIEEEALRAWPAVVECLADSAEARTVARLVEAQLTDLFARFRKVRAAEADRLAGCRTAQLADVRTAAQDLLLTIERFEDEIIGPR